MSAFVRSALRHWKASITDVGDGTRARLQINLQDVSPIVRDTLPIKQSQFTARFALPVQAGEVYLHRTHPIVEALATGILDAALDSKSENGAARCAVTRTAAVDRRTTLLLVRSRYHIDSETRRQGASTASELLAEDCQVLAFAGSPQSPEWLSQEQAEALLNARPGANMAPELQKEAFERVLDGIVAINPCIETTVRARAQELLAAHARVRSAARLRGVTQHVEPQLPPDILGIYVFLPILSTGPTA